MADAHTFGSARKKGVRQGLNERQIEADCHFALTLRLLGLRWRPAILWKVAEGVCGYGELKRALPGIADTALSRELAALRQAGLLHRTEIPRGLARATVYGLTPRGSSLLPLLAEMHQWGEAERCSDAR